MNTPDIQILLNAGPDCVTVGYYWCSNCQRPIIDQHYHQCLSRMDRAA